MHPSYLLCDDGAVKNEALIPRLVEDHTLQTGHIINAFKAIDRKDFVPKELEAEAYRDAALPIGKGQTISQPSTVAFMLELLQPQHGNYMLDVGSGSGWTTALLAQIAGPSGRVIGTEILPEVASFGRENLAKYNFQNADIRRTDVLGAPQEAPFDRILVSAAGDHVPEDLLKQLRAGILVMPVGNSIVRVRKGTDGKISGETYEGFAFVPLRH